MSENKTADGETVCLNGGLCGDDYYPCELVFECMECTSRNTVMAWSEDDEPKECWICDSKDIECIDRRAAT